MGEMRKVCKILVGKPEGKRARPLGRPVSTRVYPKVSGLSHNEINSKKKKKKQHKGLWWQNSID
jgi:hypothetical protein